MAQKLSRTEQEEKDRTDNEWWNDMKDTMGMVFVLLLLIGLTYFGMRFSGM